MMTPFGYSFGHYCLFSYDVMKVFWAFYASYRYFCMEDDTGGVFFLVYGIILSFTIAIGKNRALKIYDQFASRSKYQLLLGNFWIKYYPKCAISRNFCDKNIEYKLADNVLLLLIKYFDFPLIEFLGVMKEKSGLMKALVWFKLLECWIFLFLLITFLIDLIELSNKFRVLMIPEQYEKFSLQKKVL